MGFERWCSFARRIWDMHSIILIPCYHSAVVGWRWYDAAPPWEVMAGVVGLFALHWIEFRLQQPRRSSPHAPGRAAGQPRMGVALLLILIPVTNVNPFIYSRF